MLDDVVTRRPDLAFLEAMRAMEPAYLLHADPLLRSGFGGGLARWEAERRPLTMAVDRTGSFLDVGCANGWLAKSVVEWCAAAGTAIDAYGVDLGEELIADALVLLGAGHAWAADAWSWQPPRPYTYVYSVLELAPPEMRTDWVLRLAGWVEPGGRLIVGSYGSRSRAVTPLEVAPALQSAGLAVTGTTEGGAGPVTRFAWATL